MSFLVRKLALQIKPTIQVEVKDDEWTITSLMTFKTLVWNFKLGEETVVDTTEGTTKVIFTLEEDKLIQTPVTKNDKAMMSVRHFTDEGMVQTLTHKASGTTAIRHFRRS
nr:fatty acid-binding protein-like [Cherax quadricarinatus]